MTYRVTKPESEAHRLREKRIPDPDSTIVEGPCTICGGVNRWWNTVGVGPYCSECLPPATRTLVGSEEAYTDSFGWMARRRRPAQEPATPPETPADATEGLPDLVDPPAYVTFPGVPWAASRVLIRPPLEGEDEFDAQARRLRACQARYGEGWQTRDRPAPGTVCTCGAVETVESPLHDGASVALDCARCGRFLRFKRWLGQELPQPAGRGGGEGPAI